MKTVFQDLIKDPGVTWLDLWQTLEAAKLKVAIWA